MKIDRLIGILSILLQNDIATAPSLAEQFEVSRRTINRDIDDLCKAGIPIVTKQGVGGGISIMENYKLNYTLLTNTEMKDILAGLRSLDSVNGTNRYGQLMEKLYTGSSNLMTGNQSILIDLSSWHKNSLAPKIELIRTTIDKNKKLQFHYFSKSSETQRMIEPYYLIFRWSNWYVWGWCENRKEFRLFKLNRMEQLQLSHISFEKRETMLPDLSNDKIFPERIKIRAIFESDCKWRLVEEYGVNCFEEQSDGTLLFQADYTNKDYLISWLMAFGDKVVLQSPLDIKDEIKAILKKMTKNYEK